MILSIRAEEKAKGSKLGGILNKLHVAEPVPRDKKVRSPHIPTSVVRAKELHEQGVERIKLITQKDKERENGGAGIYDKDDKCM